MAIEPLRVDRDAGALRITLDRPEVLNALSFELLDALREALEGPAAHPEVRAVLLTGAGRAFCSGADLGATPLGGDIGAILEAHYHPVVRALVALPKPVVAAVHGVAAGAGLGLALACDSRWLAPSASFALGFTARGLAMDASCSYFLPRVVGLGRAFELAYTGRRVDAEEAMRIGLGDALIPDEPFVEAAWDRVRQLAGGPTLAYALVKRELRASLDHDLEAQLALEAEMQARAATSADVREGLRAFREKRTPRFEGR